ncbi:MAG TPA: TonB-dependent receptor [Kofleriaceae bacterium]|nr:TonB-dependent receptor [Kofleriaceae bacterium]
MIAALAAAPRPAAGQAAPVRAGPVLDGQTLAPVKGALVKVGGASCRTDATGHCRLRGEIGGGPLQISIEARGYDTFEEEVESAAALADRMLVLLPEASGGEVIEVRGRPSDERPPAPGRQEVTRSELTRIPGSRGDALTSVKSLPGVGSVDAAGPGAGLLVLRGAAPEDSKISIDGIEIPIAYHFFGVQSILPSEFIDAIEFQPGGFGVEEGRSTGGILDITTRAEQPSEVSGFAEISFINGAALLQGPIAGRKDLHFAIAGRRSLIDALLPAAVPDDVDLFFVTAPQYYDGQVRVDYRPSFRSRLTFLGIGSYDLLSLVNETIEPNEPLLTGTFENSTSFTRAITTWMFEGDRVTSRLTAAVGTTGLRVDIGPERHLQFDTRRAEIREDAELDLTDRLGLRAGGEARHNISIVDTRFPLPPSEGGMAGAYNFSAAPPIDLDFEAASHLAGAYVAADLRPVEPVTVTSGLRVDHFARFDDTTWSPRTAVQARLTRRLTARAALGTYTRPPEQSEALTRSLDAEVATQTVLGADVEVAGGVTASSNAFYTSSRSLVVQDPVLAQVDPENAYVNRGTGRARGVELVLKARRDDFFGWVAYTLSRSDRVDGPLAGRRLFDYDQTHNLVAVASWIWRKWQFGGRWQYATGIPTTPIVGSIYMSDLNIYVPVLGELNSDRIEASHQLDLRVDRKFSLPHVELSVFLDVTNVYAHPKTLGFRYNFDYSERQAITDLPILPAFGVRGTF